MRWVFAAATILALACAQVPRESVELSATVGRDIAVAHKAHRATARLLFARMRQDINAFVDDVYAPFQIRRTLAEFKAELFAKITAAAAADASAATTQEALAFLRIYLEEVRAEIESYRNKLLQKVEGQETEVVSAIDRTYEQIHHANSIVTGHLASIVKVHDAQEELLNQFGIKDLRSKVGARVANASNKIGSFVEKARKADTGIEKLKGDFEELVDDVTARPEPEPTEG